MREAGLIAGFAAVLAVAGVLLTDVGGLTAARYALLGSGPLVIGALLKHRRHDEAADGDGDGDGADERHP